MPSSFFAEQKIYLVSQAANDLNFTFVVDEEQGDRLVEQLHALLIHPEPARQACSARPGKSCSASPARRAPRTLVVAGEIRRAAQRAGQPRCGLCVRLAPPWPPRARDLLTLKSVDRVHYATKANWNPALLKLLHAAGLEDGMRVRARSWTMCSRRCPAFAPTSMLFTPNFAPRAEYEYALSKGVNVTLDNLHALREWPELFKGRRVLVRIDTGTGRGHHHHVRTGGTFEVRRAAVRDG
jgi:diaminopimelate decarboxylase/aspartate kinase